MPKNRKKLALLTATLLGVAPCAASAHGVGVPGAASLGIGMPGVGFAVGGTGLTSFYMLGFELGPWQEYLAQELTPDYLMPENALPVHVSWLRSHDVMLLPDFASGLEAQPDTYFYMNFEWQSSGSYIDSSAATDASFDTSLFERQYFAPGIQRQVSENGILGVSAVIAYQRYSAANLGLLSATTPENLGWANTGYQPFEESGYGTGVRLALRQEFTQRFALETGFQSRIDMEEFAAYRGVYSSPADLDIPARASFGVEFKASERSWLNVSVERVLYSEINAFPSRFLPNRLLSLLGDSTSPSFDWNDLTVYTVGWSWSDGVDHQWNVDFSTRPQPSPSSLLLSRAIEGDLADSAVTVGYSRRTGRTSRLSFNAAYAPAEYAFGGSVLGVTTDELGQRFEVEALWTMQF